MHTEERHDGRFFRKLFERDTEDELRAALKTEYERAIADPRVKRIVQERLSLDGPCPCGSQHRFRTCCL